MLESIDAVVERSSTALRTRRGGFSLVEILVVISIIAIVCAICVPAFINAKEGSLQSRCTTQLHQIHLAFEQYTSDNNNVSPVGISYIPLRPGIPVLKTYGLTQEQMICPDSDVKPPSSSYLWQILALGLHDGIGPDLNIEAEKAGSQFRIVICTAHDQRFYAPREQEVDYVFQKAFTLSLLASGAVVRERGVVARLPVR